MLLVLLLIVAVIVNINTFFPYAASTCINLIITPKCTTTTTTTITTTWHLLQRSLSLLHCNSFASSCPAPPLPPLSPLTPQATPQDTHTHATPLPAGQSWGHLATGHTSSHILGHPPGCTLWHCIWPHLPLWPHSHTGHITTLATSITSLVPPPPQVTPSQPHRWATSPCDPHLTYNTCLGLNPT